MFTLKLTSGRCFEGMWGDAKRFDWFFSKDSSIFFDRKIEINDAKWCNEITDLLLRLRIDKVKDWVDKIDKGLFPFLSRIHWKILLKFSWKCRSWKKIFYCFCARIFKNASKYLNIEILVFINPKILINSLHRNLMKYENNESNLLFIKLLYVNIINSSQLTVFYPLLNPFIHNQLRN